MPSLFDRPGFMFSCFGRVHLGRDLFSQWPADLRFEIGLESVSRAAATRGFIFSGAVKGRSLDEATNR